MFDDALLGQLRDHFTNITQQVELIVSVDATAKSDELVEFCTRIAELSDNVTLRTNGDAARRPSLQIKRVGTDVSVTFAAIPLGHELTSFVLALLQVGGHPSTVDAAVLDQIRAIPGDHHFETYLSLSCQNCPDVVQAINLMSIINPRITHEAIDGALFQDEVDARQILAVPTVYHNGELFDSGRMTLSQIVARIDAGAGSKQAERFDALDPYDVLVVGGGPAGVTSAIYAARKGIRTGMVVERFGGQVMDTMAIENFTSVSATTGPELGAQLRSHASDYDIEVLDEQVAKRLIPAADEHRDIGVELANGATLQARAVVVATGARWRHMNVPGEAEYRNKGVTYCPHCDGPMFKNKRVAVIGGGNSGVEAAIDLAGVVDHVTLLEFDAALRADDVLVRKLNSLSNATVIVSAQTTEVVGDGSRVTGLRYLDRTNETEHVIDLDGVFVQIGLLPNTHWLADSIALSERGEIIVDDHGRTSVPGVFAGGDCTTVPFKQIVVAMGAGSTAALGAFDHLIRASAPTAEPELASM